MPKKNKIPAKCRIKALGDRIICAARTGDKKSPGGIHYAVDPFPHEQKLLLVVSCGPDVNPEIKPGMTIISTNYQGDMFELKGLMLYRIKSNEVGVIVEE